MEDKNTKRHPSFGMVSISRTTVGPGGIPLHGSSILHNSYFTIRLRRGKVERDSSYDQYFAEGPLLVELMLSPMQLIEMFSTINNGSGIPCTIKTIQGEKQEVLTVDSFEDDISKFQKDFEVDVKKLSGMIPDILTDVQNIRRKGRFTKKDFESLTAKLEYLKTHIERNMPFVQQSFDEKIERTKSEAVASIDALVTNIITQFGIESLQQKTINGDVVDINTIKPSLPE